MERRSPSRHCFPRAVGSLLGFRLRGLPGHAFPAGVSHTHSYQLCFKSTFRRLSALSLVVTQFIVLNYIVFEPLTNFLDLHLHYSDS